MWSIFIHFDSPHKSLCNEVPVLSFRSVEKNLSSKKTKKNLFFFKILFAEKIMFY